MFCTQTHTPSAINQGYSSFAEGGLGGLLYVPHNKNQKNFFKKPQHSHNKTVPWTLSATARWHTDTLRALISDWQGKQDESHRQARDVQHFANVSGNMYGCVVCEFSLGLQACDVERVSSVNGFKTYTAAFPEAFTGKLICPRLRNTEERSILV